jgi:GTPase
MVLMAKTDTPPKGELARGLPPILKEGQRADRTAVRRFEGMVMVLHHASTIQPRYQAMMHCGAIRVSLT